MVEKDNRGRPCVFPRFGEKVLGELIVMGVKNIIQAVKKVHTEYIVLVKEGSFYHIYGKDAYIISYLFGYKIKEIENMNVCGFPINSINRIVAKLETNKINYLILDKRNNYDIEEIYNNKNLNTYNKFYNESKCYINKVARINNINQFLINNINSGVSIDI